MLRDNSKVSYGLSPRMRGCFLLKALSLLNRRAFPAYAGMFLLRLQLTLLVTCFPRVCGDVSRLLLTTMGNY